MKRILLLTTATFLGLAVLAQGNSNGKGNNKAKASKEQPGKVKAKKTSTPDQSVYGNKASVGKASKNQPAKVRDAFMRDYPNATNVVWNKYRGDWTATFGTGLGTSTAVYHANGQRKDTRTVIGQNQLPGTIWDRIFKRDRVNPVGSVVQIQNPTLRSEIFRIATQSAGSQLRYLFYNANGQQVKYDY